MTEHFVNNSDPSGDATTLLFAGDLVLDVEAAEHWLSGIAPAVQAADIAIGHLEVPHTARGQEMGADVPAPGADPANLEAIAEAGFHALTLAGNHIADCGPEGIEDTISTLDRLGVKHTGAGANLKASRTPARLDIKGRSIALLSYNCVGPEASWATADTAGCAYLRIATADGSTITPSAPLSDMTQDARAILQADIAAAREGADLVVVALHKGIVHTPAKLAAYERPLAHAAVEAGADIVVSHHAHIVRGIEFHLGKPIFHGLGNGCVVTRALSPDQNHPARAAWARRRRELFGFEPDPAYTLAPFHPEAVNAMFGQVIWHGDGRLEVGFLPIDVEAPGRPRLADPCRASEIANYIAAITEAAGLPPLVLSQKSGMVVVS